MELLKHQLMNLKKHFILFLLTMMCMNCLFSCSTKKLDDSNNTQIHQHIRILHSHKNITNVQKAYSLFLNGHFELNIEEKIYH